MISALLICRYLTLHGILISQTGTATSQSQCKITMQTQCSDWNTELDHNANVTPMTGWRQLKPAALFKVHFVAWLILRLC